MPNVIKNDQPAAGNTFVLKGCGAYVEKLIMAAPKYDGGDVQFGQLIIKRSVECVLDNLTKNTIEQIAAPTIFGKDKMLDQKRNVGRMVDDLRKNSDDVSRRLKPQRIFASGHCKLECAALGAIHACIVKQAERVHAFRIFQGKRERDVASQAIAAEVATLESQRIEKGGEPFNLRIDAMIVVRIPGALAKSGQVRTNDPVAACEQRCL